MNANREEPAEKRTLADRLLAIDNQMPGVFAEGREIAQTTLRRDRRRVRILTSMTFGMFLILALGICYSALFFCLKIAPAMNKHRQDMAVLQQLLGQQRPQPSKPDLLDVTARITGGQGYALFFIQALYFWGILALLAIILVSAVCTVLLIMASRRATLRQIQASLLALSEQLGTLQTSVHASGDQATQTPPHDPVR